MPLKHTTLSVSLSHAAMKMLEELRPKWRLGNRSAVIETAIRELYEKQKKEALPIKDALRNP